MAISRSKIPESPESGEAAIPFIVAYDIANGDRLNPAEVSAIGVALFEQSAPQDSEHSNWWSNGLFRSMRTK
jgi:hypothetical protein